MALLSQIPVTIDGSWISRSPRRWEGCIEADCPIAGLALIDRAGEISWCRARRSQSSKLTVSLLIGEQPDMRTHVAWRLGDVDGTLNAWTQPHEPLDDLIINESGTTGEAFWFLGVGVAPTVRVGVYLVAEAETASARLRLWHLQRGFAASSHIWTGALNYARTGKVRKVDLAG